MRSLLPVLFFLFHLVLCEAANARLQESESQLTGRYGEPYREQKSPYGDQGHIFRNEGWSITVFYLNGYCHYIQYNKSPKSENGPKVILDANVKPMRLWWEKSNDVSFVKRITGRKIDLYTRSDKAAFAEVENLFTTRVLIYSKKWADHVQAKKAATEKQKEDLPKF